MHDKLQMMCFGYFKLCLAADKIDENLFTYTSIILFWKFLITAVLKCTALCSRFLIRSLLFCMYNQWKEQKTCNCCYIDLACGCTSKEFKFAFTCGKKEKNRKSVESYLAFIFI